MIDPEEIAHVLRRIARGETRPETVDAWPRRVWRFRAEGYEVEVFDDVGEFDCVEWAVAPDGRKTTFQEWWDANERQSGGSSASGKSGPVGLLAAADLSALEAIMSREEEAFVLRTKAQL